MATINFTLQGIEDEDEIHLALDKIRGRYCRWAKEPGKKRGGRPFKGALIWELANTGHYAAHLFLHVPVTRIERFRLDLAKWVAKETKSELAPQTLDIKSVYNEFGLRKYLLKGLDPKFCPLYRIRHVPQGKIRGKRFGYTKNLGPSECLKHGTKRPYRWPNHAETNI